MKLSDIKSDNLTMYVEIVSPDRQMPSSWYQAMIFASNFSEEYVGIDPLGISFMCSMDHLIPFCCVNDSFQECSFRKYVQTAVSSIYYMNNKIQQSLQFYHFPENQP